MASKWEEEEKEREERVGGCLVEDYWISRSSTVVVVSDALLPSFREVSAATAILSPAVPVARKKGLQISFVILRTWAEPPSSLSLGLLLRPSPFFRLRPLLLPLLFLD